MDYDEILGKINGFGKWQKVILLLTLPIFAIIGSNVYIYEFLATKPNSARCKIPQCESLQSYNFIRFTIPKNEEGRFEECLRFVNNSTKFCGPSHFSSGLVTKCTDGYVFPEFHEKAESMVAEWEMICDKEWMRSLPYSSHMLGEIIGCSLSGILSDRLGRKKIFLTGVSGYVSLGLILAHLPESRLISYYIFLAVKVFWGIACNFMYTSGLMLLLEYTDPYHRAICSSWADISSALGGILISGLSWYGGFHNWRSLVFYSNLPFLLLLSYYFIIPESPRWLIAKGKLMEAKKAIQKIAETNGHWNEFQKIPWNPSPELLSEEDEEIDLRSKKFGIVELFRHFGMRIFIMSNVFICGLAFYFGIAFQTSVFGPNVHFNVLIFNLIEIPGVLLVRFLQDYFGRKVTVVYALILGGSALGLSGVLDNPYSLTFAVIAKFFGTITYAVMYTMTSEIYPTILRARGMSFQEFVAFAVSFFWPYFFDLSELFQGLPHLILTIWAAGTAAMVILYIPETRGKNLPNTVEDALLLEQTI